jgi:hypothetical protein
MSDAEGEVLDRAIEAAMRVLTDACDGDKDSADVLWSELLVGCVAFELDGADADVFAKL